LHAQRRCRFGPDARLSEDNYARTTPSAYPARAARAPHSAVPTLGAPGRAYENGARQWRPLDWQKNPGEQCGTNNMGESKRAYPSRKSDRIQRSASRRQNTSIESRCRAAQMLLGVEAKHLRRDGGAAVGVEHLEHPAQSLGMHVPHDVDLANQ